MPQPRAPVHATVVHFTKANHSWLTDNEQRCPRYRQWPDMSSNGTKVNKNTIQDLQLRAICWSQAHGESENFNHEPFL